MHVVVVFLFLESILCLIFICLHLSIFLLPRLSLLCLLLLPLHHLLFFALLFVLFFIIFLLRHCQHVLEQHRQILKVVLFVNASVPCLADHFHPRNTSFPVIWLECKGSCTETFWLKTVRGGETRSARAQTPKQPSHRATHKTPFFLLFPPQLHTRTRVPETWRTQLPDNWWASYWLLNRQNHLKISGFAGTPHHKDNSSQIPRNKARKCMRPAHWR